MSSGSQCPTVSLSPLLPSMPQAHPVGLQGQCGSEPLRPLSTTHNQPGGPVLADTRYRPSPRVPSCKAQDTRTRTCRTSLQVVGKGATQGPLPTLLHYLQLCPTHLGLDSANSSSGPSTLGWLAGAQWSQLEATEPALPAGRHTHPLELVTPLSQAHAYPGTSSPIAMLWAGVEP